MELINLKNVLAALSLRKYNDDYVTHSKNGNAARKTL